MKSLLDDKDDATSKRYSERMIHILANFGVLCSLDEYEFINDTVLAVIVIKKLNKWIYITNGLSELDQPNNFGDTRLELMCYTRKKIDSIKTLLLEVAKYPFQHKEDLWVWDTIPAPMSEIGLPSQYKGIILTPPALVREEAEFFKIDEKLVRVLNIQGIYDSEMAHAIKNGGQGIGEKIFKLKSPWLDRVRQKVC